MGRSIVWVVLVLLVGCDGGGGGGGGGDDVMNPLDNPTDGPPAGNPNGHCPIPAEARTEDTTGSTNVIGDGTAASCTGEAFANAVSRGGIITFNCGPDPITIDVTRTAKVVNDTGPKIVIDGGGKVVLDGKGKRILYMNTCDQAQKWTTSHCQNQDHPQLTIQNLTFVNGDATGEDPDGGGAVFVRGGRLKIVNSRFFANRCDPTGPDVGGASVRTLSQYQPAGMSEPLPVFVVNTTFGGSPELGNKCSNGGGLSSIGVSHTVINSMFTFNNAIGNGANPAKSGTPGGGSGAAIYNDGNEFTLSLCGTEMTDNDAIEGGGAIFFVSNNRSGHLKIDQSVLRRNPSHGFETLPGIFVLAAEPPMITNSTVE